MIVRYFVNRAPGKCTFVFVLQDTYKDIYNGKMMVSLFYSASASVACRAEACTRYDKSVCPQVCRSVWTSVTPGVRELFVWLGQSWVWDRGLMTRPVSDRPRSWSWSYNFGLGLGLGLAASVLASLSFILLDLLPTLLCMTRHSKM